MIEVTILNYVSSKLSIPVLLEVPSPIPDFFVVIRKSDTGRDNMLDTATFVAESYAPTLLQAAVLNHEVKGILDDLTELPEISASKLATDYPFPDTTIEKYRYQAVYTITHY